MSVSGALQPPPGQTINYVNSPDIGGKLVNTSLATTALAAFFVGVRMSVKLGVTHGTGLDDYLMIIALLFAIVQATINVLLVRRWGVGHHSWDVPLQNYQPMLDEIEINTTIYLFAIMFIKLSILIFYYRLFSINKRFRWALYGTMALVIGYCISLALAIIFQCNPPAAVWNLMLREHSECPVSMIKVDVAIGGFNIPTDIIILILPLPMLWKLQMPLAKKLGLMAILATGIFVCVTAMVRQGIVVKTLKNSDEAWTVVDSMIWLTLETNVGIICGCLPSLNPIFRILHDKGYFSFSTSLRSVFSASNRKSSGSEGDEGSKDKEKNTYRVLVESGQSKGRECSQTHLRDKESESSLPDVPLAAHTKKSLSEQPQASKQGDIEQGRIWVTDQFGYH